MRLIKLSSNQPSFHNIKFNPFGMSIITGEMSRAMSDSNLRGNCNGVGKTTALRLINFCLGAQSYSEIKKIPPEWVFSLEFELNSKKHLIERSIDSNAKNKIYLDEAELSLKNLHEFFNQNGPFLCNTANEAFTFRGLIPRFLRQYNNDMNENIFSVKADYTPADALLRALFLLGGRYQFALQKKEKAIKLKLTKDQIKNLQTIEEHKKEYGNGIDPAGALAWNKEKLKVLTQKLDEMKIFEAFEEIQKEIKLLDDNIRELSKNISINSFQIDVIDKSLSYTPDMTSEELRAFYTGLEHVFKPEVLEYFDNVEKFHMQMAINRKARLENDKAEIIAKNEMMLKKCNVLKETMKELESQLINRHSEKEYLDLARKKTAYELEIERLELVQREIKSLITQKAEIQQSIGNDLVEATSYVTTDPLNAQSYHYQQIISKFGSNIPAGISLDINDKENQLQFDLKVFAQSSASSGVTDEMILAYDWLLLTHGANHHLDFVWHDNALFAHIDGGHRAKWLEYIYQDSINSGKQYIMSINTENFEESMSFLSMETAKHLKDCVVLNLSGEDDSSKLLGIYFDDK